MWPTPTAGQCGMTATTGGRPIEKSTHLGTQVMLAERMWPTPTAIDSIAGLANKPRKDATATHSILLSQKVMMFPTPTRSDIEKWSNKTDRQSGKRLEAQAWAGKLTGECGLLNPDWVEWLMGDPIGWTDIDADAPHTISDGCWDAEPDIPRVTGTTPDRADRLRALGNQVVPQQFYPIFAAIAEIEANK